MSHGKKPNNDSQEKVPAKKRRVCSDDPAYEEEYPVFPCNNNKHTFYCIPCNKTVVVNAQVREMLIVIMTKTFKKYTQ